MISRSNNLKCLSYDFHTDKNPTQHNYTEVYEKIFPDRFAVRTMVEIGLWMGESAKLWHEYFPMASIYMIENDQKHLQNWEHNHAIHYPRVTPCPHDVKNFPWNALSNRKLDLVIDDGSHDFDDQFSAFTYGFEYVRPGGLWIIEDTHFGFVNTLDVMKCSPLYQFLWSLILGQQMEGNGLGNFYVTREVTNCSEMAKMIYGIQSYKSLIVIERAYD